MSLDPRLVALLIAGADTLLSLTVTSQWVARQFGYSPRLGPPAYVPSPGMKVGTEFISVIAGALALTSLLACVESFSARWMARGAGRRAILSLAVAIIAAIVSLAAWELGHAPLYGVAVVRWWRSWQVMVATGGATGAATLMLWVGAERVFWTAMVLFPGVGALAWLAWRVGRPQPVDGSRGTALWGTGATLAGHGGVPLGWIERGRQHVLLRAPIEGHLVTIAPTGAGKGVGAVIPALLDHPGSAIVIDPKGENYAVTAARRRAMGQQVVALDPFAELARLGVPAPHAAMNPLDTLDVTSPTAVDDARMLAEMLVVDAAAQSTEASFWNTEARALWTGLLLHVAAGEATDNLFPDRATGAARANAKPVASRSVASSDGRRTLPYARRLLAGSMGTGMSASLAGPFATVLDAMGQSSVAGGVVSELAARFVDKVDKERSGVLSTARSHTDFLDGAPMAGVLGPSTFDLSRLSRGDVTLYLVLPADRLSTHARWLRLVIACALRSVRVRPVRDPRAPRVLVLLDELGVLGRMRPIEQALAFDRGYGVTLWCVVQDLGQLTGTYPDSWRTFLAGPSVVQVFGTNDIDTAEYFSRRAGETTVAVASGSVSRRGGHAASDGVAVTEAGAGRRLIFPDEILRMSAEEQLLFVRGEAPIRAQRLDYREDKRWRAMAAPNPLYSTVPERGGS